MKDQELNTSLKLDDLKMMYPVWSFIHRHLFQIVAMAIPMIGVAGFTAGTSYLEGWNRAAGVGSNLFPVGVNETILLGLKLERPWLYSCVLVTTTISYLYLVEMLGEWERAKWGRENFFQLKKRKKLAKAASAARKIAGISHRFDDPSNRDWKKLGPRMRWASSTARTTLKAKRWQRVVVRTVALPLFLFTVGVAVICNILFKQLIVKEAHAEGAAAYTGIYVAITGKLPSNYDEKITNARLQQFACDGYELLWGYRSVEIEVGHQPAAVKEQAYIIHSTDRLFFLLDKNGSRLHSFGDASYSLREIANRPTSEWTSNCKKLYAAK